MEWDKVSAFHSAFAHPRSRHKLNAENRSEIETQSQLKKEFDLILRRIIRESLKSISENLDSVIYYVLEQKYDVKEEEIADNIAEFSKCLQMVFGKKARTFIEEIITVNLYVKIKENHNQIQEKDFAEKIEHAKQKYIQKKKI